MGLWVLYTIPMYGHPVSVHIAHVWTSSFSSLHSNARITLPMATLSDSTKFRVGTLELDSEDTRRARVLYDYDANGFDELSVSRDQVLGLVVYFITH